ncbi:MAG: hypothetical protein SFU98_14325 [Leptospiraceae bacterium]|nr:hypothetical protein [Leptospiraceae bacterium]
MKSKVSQIIAIVLCITLLGCENQSKEKFPIKKELLAIAYLSVKEKEKEDCKNEYKSLNTSLYSNYLSTQFSKYSNSCENVIIGDSTMDLAKLNLEFYDRSKTLNYAVAGNTACDYLYQFEGIGCSPKNVLIATPDGNGVLRKVVSSTSITMIKKLTDRIKQKWNSKIVIIGIHPVLLSNENLLKNPVNKGVKDLGYCYIDPNPIFGVSESEMPSQSLMVDQIHYSETIYPKYRQKIIEQCGIQF